jgi:hypothetical protein
VVPYALPGLGVFDETDDRVDQLVATGAQQALFAMADEVRDAVVGPRDDRYPGRTRL